MRVEDRNTGRRSLGDRIVSFAANLIVPTNNRDHPDNPARVGVADYDLPPDAPIFGALWHAIRTAVVDVVR